MDFKFDAIILHKDVFKKNGITRCMFFLTQLLKENFVGSSQIELEIISLIWNLNIVLEFSNPKVKF